jgi:hypothetical protein
MNNTKIETINEIKTIAEPYVLSRLRRTAIRLVKANPGIYGRPEIKIESDFAVQLLEGGVFEEESEGEYYFYVEHEEQDEHREIGFRVHWPNCSVSEVLCELCLVPFRVDADGFNFTVDVKGFAGRSKTMDVHTHIHKPGLTINNYQNHPLRTAGRYKCEPYPQCQIDAASHYIYASREVLLALEIPAYLVDNQLGYVALLGFETNSPLHGDYPAHWHLIYRWPDYAGSQAPHFYLNENGENTHNIVTIDGIPGVRGTYNSEEWCFFKDRLAQNAFAIKICQDGGIAIAMPGKPTIRMKPYDQQKGVEIYTDEVFMGTIKVHNDSLQGRMTIQWTKSAAPSPMRDSYEEVIRYHPLLGHIVT